MATRVITVHVDLFNALETAKGGDSFDAYLRRLHGMEPRVQTKRGFPKGAKRKGLRGKMVRNNSKAA